MSEPSFLTPAEVLEIHKAQLEAFGGRPGVRDLRLLESAVAMPRASFQGEHLHRSLFDMAAAYAFHIAQNQAFVDGNKRAGLAAALLFLELNGIEIHDPKGRLYSAMIEISSRALDKEGLAKVFAKLATKG